MSSLLIVIVVITGAIASLNYIGKFIESDSRKEEVARKLAPEIAKVIPEARGLSPHEQEILAKRYYEVALKTGFNIRNPELVFVVVPMVVASSLWQSLSSQEARLLTIIPLGGLLFGIMHLAKQRLKKRILEAFRTKYVDDTTSTIRRELLGESCLAVDGSKGSNPPHY